MRTAPLLFALGTMVLFVACKKEEVEEPDLGHGYFPTDVGT